MTPVDLDEVRRRYEGVYKPPPGTRWQLTARASANDVPALCDEIERLRALTATCTCGTSPMTYEGPEADCPVHGAVRAFNEAQREIEALRAEITKLKNGRLLSVLFGHHKGAPRPFALQRRAGYALVALGAEFPDGAVALRLANDGGWTTKSEGGAQQFSNGDMEILWLSDELESLAVMEAELEATIAQLTDAEKHSQCASAPEFAASAPAQSSECASALIEGALHSDTQEGSVRRAADSPKCSVCGQQLMTKSSIARGVCIRCQPVVEEAA